jgi:hypothetical protein
MSHPNADQAAADDLWADQVVRRQSFEAAHPGVAIAFTREPWTWTATCQVDGHERVITEHELCYLLDRLERITSGPEPAC